MSRIEIETDSLQVRSLTKIIVQYSFKVSRTEVMHLVVTRLEKVLAFSGDGNYCSPARTGTFHHSDGCISCSGCSGSSFSPRAVPQFASSSPRVYSDKVGAGGPSKFLLGGSALLGTCG